MLQDIGCLCDSAHSKIFFSKDRRSQKKVFENPKRCYYSSQKNRGFTSEALAGSQKGRLIMVFQKEEE